jgi:hypothetical protein
MRIWNSIPGTNLNDHTAVDFLFLLDSRRKIEAVVRAFRVGIRSNQHLIADEYDLLAGFEFHWIFTCPQTTGLIRRDVPMSS